MSEETTTEATLNDERATRLARRQAIIDAGDNPYPEHCDVTDHVADLAARYAELGEDDVVCTVLTDSAVMYQSRIEELNEMHGAYNAEEARLDHNLHMLGLKTDSMMELTYEDRKRIHNLKYYTWVEQQARDVKDLNALWYDTKGTWDAVHAQAKDLDELINAFNEEVGLLKTL